MIQGFVGCVKSKVELWGSSHEVHHMLWSVLRKIILDVEQRMDQRGQRWKQRGQFEHGFIYSFILPLTESVVSCLGNGIARTGWRVSVDGWWATVLIPGLWVVCNDHYDSPCPWSQYLQSMDFRSRKTLEIKFNPLIVEIKGLRWESLSDLSKTTLVSGDRGKMRS